MTERTIREIIEGQEPLTSTASMTVAEAAQLMKRRNVGAMMVVDGDKLVGMFTERDALFRVLAGELDGKTTLLSEVMTPNPRTIQPNRLFVHALGIMHEGRFRHLPVIEDGRPIGMISARDAFGPELEAFVYELLRQEQVSQILA